MKLVGRPLSVGKLIQNFGSRPVAIFSAAVLCAVSCSPITDSQEVQAARLVFERIKIADTSGDIKLVGDIDGDGKLDLVLGGFPSDPLSWWHWPDLRRTTIGVPRVEFTTHGALVDLDGDGDLDIVTGDGNDGPNLVWFENPGPHGNRADGSQWRRHEIGAVGGWVKDVAALDFDDDGRVDIAVRSPREVMIYFQDGPSIWQRVVLAGFNLGEEGMASGDIDGDGDFDLLLWGEWVANPGGAAARVPARWRGHRIGVFNQAFKALVVDIDGDGRVDVLTSSSEHTADIAWFRADAGPTGRWTRHVIQPSVSGAHTLQAADMDGDGDIDVVVGQMHTTKEKTIAIHYNSNGLGTRWSRQDVDNTGLHNGIVADIDGDGNFDIFGSNWAGNPPLYVWINRLDPSAPGRRLNQ